MSAEKIASPVMLYPQDIGKIWICHQCKTPNQVADPDRRNWKCPSCESKAQDGMKNSRGETWEEHTFCWINRHSCILLPNSGEKARTREEAVALAAFEDRKLREKEGEVIMDAWRKESRNRKCEGVDFTLMFIPPPPHHLPRATVDGMKGEFYKTVEGTKEALDAESRLRDTLGKL